MPNDKRGWYGFFFEMFPIGSSPPPQLVFMHEEDDEVMLMETDEPMEQEG